MVVTFSGVTANEVWASATQKLLCCEQTAVESRIGNMNEILHVAFSISNPREHWVTRRVPPISIAYALAELVWILVGSNESKTINFWNPALPRYSGQSEKYPGAYGFRIRRNFGLDQLERAYYSLKNEPNNRQTVISIWDPKKDLPDEKGKPANDDIPCNICALLKIREQKLEWTQIMRSNDIFRGLPYNLVQFTCLQEILAGWLDVGVGSYSHFSDSLHLYNSDRASLSITDNINLENSDYLALPKDIFSDVVSQIYDNMLTISHDEITEIELSKLSKIKSNEQAYCNIMFIIGAYAAHKLKFTELEKELLEKCTNKLYVYMWKSWSEYNKSKESDFCG